MSPVITKRFDLNLGKRCNERCEFCYYLEEIESGDTRDRTTAQIKDILKVGRRWGKRRVDLTGGEPTIRRDLPEVIAYAREIGYETVCMITNGLVTANKARLRSFVDAGLNDILVSLHAHEANAHDMLTKMPGAHRKVLKTLENAQAIGLHLRVNHVVTNTNYQDVGKLAGLVAPFKPYALNYIVFNPTRDAAEMDKQLGTTYHDVAPVLKEAIECYTSEIPTINIRHLPFCFLKGKEKHVKTMWQLQYESAEWDWCMDIIHKRGSVFMAAAALAGSFLLLNNRRFWRSDNYTRVHDALQKARMRIDRVQPKVCAGCDLRHVCDGIPKEYYEDRGGGDLRPYRGGTTILDPTHFMCQEEKESPMRASDFARLSGTPKMWFGQRVPKLSRTALREYQANKRESRDRRDAKLFPIIVSKNSEAAD